MTWPGKFTKFTEIYKMSDIFEMPQKPSARGAALNGRFRTLLALLLSELAYSFMLFIPDSADQLKNKEHEPLS